MPDFRTQQIPVFQVVRSVMGPLEGRQANEPLREERLGLVGSGPERGSSRGVNSRWWNPGERRELGFTTGC